MSRFVSSTAPSSLALLSLATAAGVSLPALAQDEDISQVVITAAGYEQKITEAPASISVISQEELAKRPYTSLIDALRDIEGIDAGMESTDKNGMATISMRGMPSDYTLVLINGRRQSNVGDLYPNNFGGGQFAFLPPLDSIERIEVVRGPMSTLYGSDAMGGVINIITRRTMDRWVGSGTVGHTLQSDDQFGNDATYDMQLSGPLLADKLGLAVRGSYYDREASNPEWPALELPDGTMWTRELGFGGGGRQVANTNWNGGIQLSFTPNAAHDIRLDYELSKQKFDNSEGQTGTLDSPESLWRSGNVTLPNPAYNSALPTGPGNQPTITRRVVQPRVGYTAYQRYNRDQVALSHTGRWSFGTSETSLMKSSTENLGRSLPLTVDERDQLQSMWNSCAAGTPANRPISCLDASQFLPRPLRTLSIDNLIADAKLDMKLGAAHKLTLGGQYIDAEMEDGTFGMFGDGFVAGTVQPHKQWALFAEDAWRITDTLTATGGIRFDRHNLFGSQVSPRGYLVWSGLEKWTLKGGVSTGYKTPKPNQLFPGITGFGGQGVSPFVGTPSLQPETSVNTELAAYFEGGNGYNFNATVFLNRFEDKIATGDAVPNCEVAPAGTACVDVGPGWAELGFLTFSQATNIDKAETRGLELSGTARLPWNLDLRANYTFTDSEQKSGPDIGRPIAGNPARHMINATLTWQATEKVGMFLNTESRSKRYRAVVDNVEQFYKDYTILHLGGTFRVSQWLNVNARINNLLDKNFIEQDCLLTQTQDAFTCTDSYLIKDKRRSYWMSANIRF